MQLRKYIAQLIYPDIAALEQKAVDAEHAANRRFAELVANMDPLEPILKEFHGVFSKEYERPEDKLDARGQLGMIMWGYTQDDDPYFEYLTEWIMNTHANETLKRSPVTTERVLYGRALLAVMMLVKGEVKRLANLYRDKLEHDRLDASDFDESISTDT